MQFAQRMPCIVFLSSATPCPIPSLQQLWSLQSCHLITSWKQDYSARHRLVSLIPDSAMTAFSVVVR